MSAPQQHQQQQETYVSRFVLDGNKKLYLRSLWGDDHFSLFVTDGRYLWHGDASASFIESNMLIRGLEMDNFIRRSKAALVTQDNKISKKKYTYKVNQGEKLTDLEFTWFFRLGQTDIMARCMLPLARVSDGQQAQRAMHHILDFFVDRRNYLERQNNDLSELNKSLKTQRDEALAQFAKLVEDKKSLESELYKKFVLVLNEKKQKIRELKDAVEHATSVRIERRDEKNDSNEVEEDGQSESEGNNSSDRSPHSSTPLKHKRLSSSPFNTSSISFNVHDKVTPSLDLLDSSEIVVTTTVRRRHRHDGQTEKAKDKNEATNHLPNPSTPSKPLYKSNFVTPIKGKGPRLNVNSPFATPSREEREEKLMMSRKRRRALDDNEDANDLIDELM